MIVVALQVDYERIHATVPCEPSASKWEFPKIKGTILGVRIIGTILYWDHPIQEN